MKKIIIAITVLFVYGQVMGRNYPDSVREASQAQSRIYKGFSIDVSGGVGISRIDFQHWGQKGNDAFRNNNMSHHIAFPSGNVGIGLTYYFVPCFGLGTGLEFSTYRSYTKMGPWSFEGTDKYGDKYIQTLSTDAKEQQDIYMLEVPIGLHFRAIGEGKRAGFIGALGVKLGFPVKSTYELNNAATINNSVYYPTYDLTMSQVPSVLENGSIPAYSGSFGTVAGGNSQRKMNTLNYAGYVQAGVLIQLSQRIDMSITAFATYYINDVFSTRGNDEVRFGNNLPKNEYPTIMSDTRSEQGLLNTNTVKDVHPWNVGLKIGFHFNTDKTDAERAYDREQRRLRNQVIEEPIYNEPIYSEPIYEEPVIEQPIEEIIEEPVPVVVPIVEEEHGCTDTLYIYVRDTVYIHDTVYVGVEQPADEAVNQLNEVMEKSIIWFGLDSDEPILEPADILVQIADILKQHPDQQVYVNGHACQLGRADYNRKLAMRRAFAVATELENLGVRRDQMIVRTKGANEPYRFNGKHTLQKDRRVEVIPVEQVNE